MNRGRFGTDVGAISFSGPIHKLAPDQQVFWAWLSIAELPNGEPLVDLQGHIIPVEELEKAADAFMRDYRISDERHRMSRTGTVIGSIVTTREVQKILGVPPGTQPVGWLVKVYVDDVEVWAKVKSGEYAMMSIGGEGELEEVA